MICCDLLKFEYLCSMSNNLCELSTPEHLGCDLLKFEYLCSMSNNLTQLNMNRKPVVICLNLSTFAV